MKKKHATKGKRHYIHAESFERMADVLSEPRVGDLSRNELIRLFRDEAKRVRAILR